jgi:transcriptional regulator with XRE-family HTH domain
LFVVDVWEFAHRQYSAGSRIVVTERSASVMIQMRVIAKIEAGRMSPTVALLEKLARALRVGVPDLFARPPSKPKTRRS